MRILHTMLRVGNLDRSLSFYIGVLGMKLISRRDYPEGRFTLAFVGFSERESGRQGPGAEIELTHNWDTARYELGSAYGHIALEVDDAYAACDAVTARGGKVVRPAGPMKHGTTVIAFVEDPDGYKIEFIQRRTADATQPPFNFKEQLMDHRTVIGQDVSYRQDPQERTYTYMIYVEHHGDQVLITSDDGWYGVKTVQLDSVDEAAALFHELVADPKLTLQALYGEACDWFEPLPAQQRTADIAEPVLPSDAAVTVEVTPASVESGRAL